MDAQERYKKRFFLILTLLLSAGFIGTSLGSYLVSRQGMKTQILTYELPLTSDNIYSEIQRDLLPPIFISSLMANDSFLRNWMLSGEKDRKAIGQYLSEIQKKYNTVTAFLVSDKTRNYYHVSGVLKQVSPSSERDVWYYRVRDMDEEYEINVDPDMGNRDAMTIFINYKVYGFKGEFLGATGVGYTLDSVRNLIERYQETYNRTIFFTDRDGKVLLCGGEYQGDFSHVHEIDGLSDVLPQILSSDGFSLSYTYRDDYVYLNTRFIPEINWYLWVEQGEAGRLRHIRAVLLVNLALCLVITGLAVFLVRLLIGFYRKKIVAHEMEERKLRDVTLVQKEEILKKNSELSTKNTRLKEAMAEVRTLSGLIPICSSCKKIRDDKGYWEQIESYITAHSEATFSHGICPECIKKLYPDLKGPSKDEE